MDEYLAAGTYSLVSAGAAGVGDGSLSVTLTPASDPLAAHLRGDAAVFDIGDDYPPIPMVTGDFTGDGILDIATPEGIYLGLGDGAFQVLRSASGYRTWSITTPASWRVTSPEMASSTWP